MITLVSVLVISAHAQCYNFIIEYIMIHHTHTYTQRTATQEYTHKTILKHLLIPHTQFLILPPQHPNKIQTLKDTKI